MDELEQARSIIDKTDLEMAELFCRRMDAVKRVALYKAKYGLPVLDAAREQRVIAAGLEALGDDTLAPYYEQAIRCRMALSRHYQADLLAGKQEKRRMDMSMKLTMRLGEHSYDIIIKRGCLGWLGQLAHLERRVLVVTDDGVPAQYAQTVCEQCRKGTILTVPQGEASKSLAVYARILQAALDAGLGRGDLIVAVGGGVVGDLAAFAAATYLRGIDFINCPTTFLAQVDSSIGGKAALNLGGTKNVVGAFWQPRLVLIDPDTLNTLPRRHWVNGMAEALKMSLLCDPELFSIFEEEDPFEKMEEILYHSLVIKKNVVEKDEHDHGQRMALNFGHTLGHGIEAVRGVCGRRTKGYYHGECVALGMLPMIEDKQLARRVRAVYRKLGLPLRGSYDKEKVLQFMRQDKKVGGDFVKVVKVPGLGCWRLDTLPIQCLEDLAYGRPLPLPEPRP